LKIHSSFDSPRPSFDKFYNAQKFAVVVVVGGGGGGSSSSSSNSGGGSSSDRW
jgi:uncharacterized membrane protein